MYTTLIRHVDKNILSLLCTPFTTERFNKPSALFEQYFLEQQNGVRVFWVALINNEIVGYVTLSLTSKYRYFYEASIPEIMDLNVLPLYRKRGVGSMLLDAAEQEANKKSSVVGLGVGLYSDYGAAQRLYVKRGYIPNGKGITYQYKPCIAGKEYRLDDDLVLWLTKKLDIYNVS